MNNVVQDVVLPAVELELEKQIAKNEAAIKVWIGEQLDLLKTKIPGQIDDMVINAFKSQAEEGAIVLAKALVEKISDKV